MKRLLTILTASILLWPGVMRAQTTVYSFEAPPINPDGFGPNGGGITVTQQTTGTTDGLHSLGVSVVTGATFVGALTGVIPPQIGDPPGVDHIVFDLTIAPGQAFTGGFAVIGVTIFGNSQPGPDQQFGLQAQFADFELISGKGPGTYQVQIDLLSATNPFTFATNQSFNDIFGTVGSGPNDLIPTGFQFFINKSNDAPVTVFIDNVRVFASSVPEPASSSLLGLGVVAAGLVCRRRLQFR